MTGTRTSLATIMAAAIALLSFATSVVAANYTWNGGGSDNNWSNAANWATGVPSNDGTGDVSMAGTARCTNVIDNPWNLNSLTFNAGNYGSYAFLLSGGPLTIGAGGISNATGANQQVTANTILSADQTWSCGSADGYLGCYSVNLNGHALAYGGRGTLSIANVTGQGSMVISMDSNGNSYSPCDVFLSGANSFSGGIIVNRGSLQIQSDAALGPASNGVTLNGGIFDIQTATSGATTVNRDITLGMNGGTICAYLTQYTSLQLPGNIHGSGSLTIMGSQFYAPFVLSGHNTYTGGTILGSGRLNEQAAVQGTTDSLKGNITVANNNSGYVQFAQDFNGTYSGNISGTIAISKKGTGIVALTGNNTYTGTTMVYTGGFETSGNGTGGLSPNSFLAFEGGGGIIQFVGGGTFTRSPSNIHWNGSGGFAARDGKLTINLGGAGATLNVQDLMISYSSLVFGSPTANSAVEFVNPLVLVGSIIVQVNAGAGGDYAVMSGQISGSREPLSKSGNGLLQLTAANTYTGSTCVASGALQANDGVGLPSASPLSLASGVLMSDGTASFTRSLGTGAGQVTWLAGYGGGFAAAGGTFTVNIGGTGATQTWGATNFVSSGYPLIFGAPRACGQTIFANPINLGSATREIRVDSGLGGDMATLTGALSGTGGLNKTGSGRLELAGNNTYSGSTAVAAGTLCVNGSLSSTSIAVQGGGSLGGKGSISGKIAVSGGNSSSSQGGISLVDGSAGTLTLSDAIAGDTALTLGGTAGNSSLLSFELGTSADRIVITSGKLAVNPGGAIINITPISGFDVGVYDILTFPDGQATGLNNLTLATTTFPNGYTLSLQSTSTAEQLVVTAVPEPATLSLLALGGLTILRRRK